MTFPFPDDCLTNSIICEIIKKSISKSFFNNSNQLISNQFSFYTNKFTNQESKDSNDDIANIFNSLLLHFSNIYSDDLKNRITTICHRTKDKYFKESEYLYLKFLIS